MIPPPPIPPAAPRAAATVVEREGLPPSPPPSNQTLPSLFAPLRSINWSVVKLSSAAGQESNLLHHLNETLREDLEAAPYAGNRSRRPTVLCISLSLSFSPSPSLPLVYPFAPRRPLASLFSNCEGDEAGPGGLSCPDRRTAGPVSGGAGPGGPRAPGEAGVANGVTLASSVQPPRLAGYFGTTCRVESNQPLGGVQALSGPTQPAPRARHGECPTESDSPARAHPVPGREKS
eukprot:371085-Hanusia_phi.AAC.1